MRHDRSSWSLFNTYASRGFLGLLGLKDTRRKTLQMMNENGHGGLGHIDTTAL